MDGVGMNCSFLIRPINDNADLQTGSLHMSNLKAFFSFMCNGGKKKGQRFWYGFV